MVSLITFQEFDEPVHWDFGSDLKSGSPEQAGIGDPDYSPISGTRVVKDGQSFGYLLEANQSGTRVVRNGPAGQDHCKFLYNHQLGCFH